MQIICANGSRKNSKSPSGFQAIVGKNTVKSVNSIPRSDLLLWSAVKIDEIMQMVKLNRRSISGDSVGIKRQPRDSLESSKKSILLKEARCSGAT